MTAAPSPRPARTANLVLAALVLVGIALICVAWWVATRPFAGGWYAYAPLSETTYTPFISPSSAWPALFAALGALALGGAAGYVVGRRGRPADPVADDGAAGDVGQ
jgi:heme/copper-type cytochrome/quinol oxidase subunit 1